MVKDNRATKYAPVPEADRAGDQEGEKVLNEKNWKSLIERIQAEGNYRNGWTSRGGNQLKAISQITVRVAVQEECPIMWEIADSSKVEPASLISNLAKFNYNIMRLSSLCQSPDEVNAVLDRLVSSLEKKVN